MRCGRPPRRMLLAIIVCLLFLCDATNGRACSVSIIEQEMPPSFTIVVTDRGVPVTGLQVEVTTENSNDEEITILEGVTDSVGSFEVKNLEPGRYDIQVGHNTAFSNYVRVKVSDREVFRLSRRMELEWITEKALMLRGFSGVLRNLPIGSSEDKAESARTPVAFATIKVKDARSETLVGEATTNADGSFALDSLPAGIYVVEIVKTIDTGRPVLRFMNLSGRLPLEISAEDGTFEGPVELSAAFTSCGLSYEAKPITK